MGKRQIISGSPNLKTTAHIILDVASEVLHILVFSGVGILAKGIHRVRHKMLDGGLQ